MFRYPQQSEAQRGFLRHRQASDFFHTYEIRFSSSGRYACERSRCLGLQVFVIPALFMGYYEIFVYWSKAMGSVFCRLLFRWLDVVHSTNT